MTPESCPRLSTGPDPETLPGVYNWHNRLKGIYIYEDPRTWFYLDRASCRYCHYRSPFSGRSCVLEQRTLEGGRRGRKEPAKEHAIASGACIRRRIPRQL